MKELLQAYKALKGRIKTRLREFEANYKKDDKEIFSELCFCILTPQSNAILCDTAIKRLKTSGCLFNASATKIKPIIKFARFINKKANYIVEARKFFKKNGSLSLRPYINNTKDILVIRDWLVDNIKGIGYKEASHFLRNIGLGKDLAILDVHILKNLKRYGIIKKIPKTLTKKRYLDIESKMRDFSFRIGIPMAELDLLFWAKETGVVFK